VDDYKWWYHKVGSRFKPEVLEEAIKAPPQSTIESLEKRAKVKPLSKKRMLELVQAAKRGDPDWRSRAEDWLLEVKGRYKESFESLEKEWLEWRQARLRTTPRQNGTIEIICNGPGTGKWRLVNFKCTAPYRPEVLWTEIQSWLKDCGEDLSDLDYFHIWDEDGRVDPGIQRMPIDGERFAFLLKLKDNQEDIERTSHPDDGESAIQRFIKRTRWRRKKSIYDTGVHEEDLTCSNVAAIADGITKWMNLRPSAPSLDREDVRNSGQSPDCHRELGSECPRKQGLEKIKRLQGRLRDMCEMAVGDDYWFTTLPVFLKRLVEHLAEVQELWVPAIIREMIATIEGLSRA
jgi:hypothetical protein